MDQRDQILDFLVKDPISNINIINFIENYPIHYIEKIGDSVLVKGTSDKEWIYISSKSEAELNTIKDRLDSDDKSFAAIEDWMIPILTKGNKVNWKLSTMKLILFNEIPIGEPKNSVSELTTDDAEFIYENSDYKDVISTEYIIDRITNGINSCVRHMGTPIAWGITQDDGALGFLHVLPESRKMGYARDIALDLVKKVRATNKIPFVHIKEDNEKSMGLATSLGFKKDKVISWFEIE